jgi:ATP-binding cassette subfamily C protein CydD
MTETTAEPAPEYGLRRLMNPGRADNRRAAAFAAMATLIWPIQAVIVATALADLLTGSPPAVSPIGAALGFAGLGLARTGLSYRADYLSARAAQAVVSAAREAVISRECARSSDSALGGPGAIAALASEKIELLTAYVLRYAPAQARVGSAPLIILALAFWHSWAAGLILLITGPLIPLFMALIGFAARESSERQLAEVTSLNDLLIERLSALIDIRLLGAGAQVTGEFSARAGNLRERTMAVLRIAFLSSTVLELFAAIGVAMTAVYVGFSLLGVLHFGAWGAALTPASGIFLLLMAPEFYQPLRDLAAAWHDRAAAQAVAAELDAYLAEDFTALSGAGDSAVRLAGPPVVVLNGCTTPAGRTLPRIAIGAGEKVALIGPSGVGKTSALRLMAGLAPPGQGEVLVAGRRLSAETADGWRARLGWMPQAPHFFNTSLRHNLSLGRAGDLAPALRAAAATAVIDRLERGLATRPGETGGGLSGGEARRLTLARALHGGPDLILADEPTADLDTETARAVTEGLLAQAARGAALVIATHDMALAARMDRIIRLEEQPL